MQQVIDGGLVNGSGEAADPVLNPASEEVPAEVVNASVEDVPRAIDAAQLAAPRWGATTPATRGTALLELADLLDERTDEFARIESANVGKPRGAATEEVPLCSDHLRFFAGAARVLEGRAAGQYVEGYTSMVRREPLGVVGQITPCNYPLAMATWKIAPALAAGNTIVLRPWSPTWSWAGHLGGTTRPGARVRGARRCRGRRHRMRGTDIVCGGAPWGARGFLVAPTVILAPAQDSEIVQREVFGPVVTVQRAADEEQALEWAKDTDYGLAASVWTPDGAASLRAARALGFRCVWINTHLPFLSEMPRGGFGQSGYGKDLSIYALEE
jgi:acyl-CoA reductase-like NAD-dependent aldehyde dehydrogenase